MARATADRAIHHNLYQVDNGLRCARPEGGEIAVEFGCDSDELGTWCREQFVEVDRSHGTAIDVRPSATQSITGRPQFGRDARLRVARSARSSNGHHLDHGQRTRAVGGFQGLAMMSMTLSSGRSHEAQPLRTLRSFDESREEGRAESMVATLPQSRDSAQSPQSWNVAGSLRSSTPTVGRRNPEKAELAVDFRRASRRRAGVCNEAVFRASDSGIVDAREGSRRTMRLRLTNWIGSIEDQRGHFGAGFFG